MKTLIPLWALVAAAHAGTFSFHHENVLGTSLELRISADSEATARIAEASVIAEIDRLSGVLSTWSPDSEISRWQASGKPMEVSLDLAAVLRACGSWTANSQGAFSVIADDPLSAKAVVPWTLEGTMASYTGKTGGSLWMRCRKATSSTARSRWRPEHRKSR